METPEEVLKKAKEEAKRCTPILLAMPRADRDKELDIIKENNPSLYHYIRMEAERLKALAMYSPQEDSEKLVEAMLRVVVETSVAVKEPGRKLTFGGLLQGLGCIRNHKDAKDLLLYVIKRAKQNMK